LYTHDASRSKNNKIFNNVKITLIDKLIPEEDQYFEIEDLFFLHKKCGMMRWSTGRVQEE